jgi:phospholipase C
MGYCTPPQVPTSDFFAQNFAVCDHWFASLPTGTQPNRLMAMSGFSMIENNYGFLMENQELVYDWLNRNRVRWRVYHEGLPFFLLMPKWIPEIVEEDHFRRFAQLREDVVNEPPDEFPQVIFVEPTYTDAPHIGPSSDDHAPSPISGGQQFLLKVYESIRRNPDLWSRTVMIVTYDEHGGFFDHVSPPAVTTNPPPAKTYDPFTTLGVRVPAFVISPLVEKQTVFNGQLDHVSILKLIGQKFGRGKGYSPVVDERRVGSALEVLNRSKARDDIPAAPSLVKYIVPSVGYTPGTMPVTENNQAFKASLEHMRVQHPLKAQQKFGDLLQQF